MEDEIILIVKTSFTSIGGWLLFKLYKIVLKRFIKEDISLKVLGIRNERLKANLNKVIYFSPSFFAVLVLLLIVWYNNPFNVIDLIFIVICVSYVITNVAVAILIEELSGLRVEIDNTANGLFKLTSDLKEAKIELHSSASLALDYSKQAQQNADKAKEEAIKASVNARKATEESNKAIEEAKKVEQEAKRINSVMNYYQRGGKLGGGGFGGFGN